MASDSNTFYNRDLSWLRFNHRVLQEAGDERNPLYDRIKFLAIFSSNLDEFFKVRVSDIRTIKNLDKKLRKKLITKPNKLLKKIKKEVALQQEEFGKIFRNQIIPELKREGIVLTNHQNFSEGQKQFAKDYFNNKIEPQLVITQLEIAESQLFLENEKLYLITLSDQQQLIVIKIPEKLDRFVVFPEEKKSHTITFIDDIIKYNLAERFQTVFYAIKVSRDAELYIDNEYSGNLLNKIKESLGNRETGQATRVLIDAAAPSDLLLFLKKALDVTDTDLISGGEYHNFKDFFTFPNPSEKNLQESDLPPIVDTTIDTFLGIFEAIKQKDRLYYYPYESFDPVLRLVREAANDPAVTKIKITLYRVASQSAIASLLVNALHNKKEVFVFMETKARFDEENNIKWGKILQEKGAKVLYSYPGIKIHSKILYIERKEASEKRGYAYISTGNFNEKTSKIYTDYGLMTAKPEITEELLQVFKVIEGKMIIPRTKHLLISPFTTRNVFKNLIRSEINNAINGQEAYIILKMNSLEDKKMINLLYEANNAGVKIRLLIRGICCLVPGVEGQSEHILVTSIVDRFLEHGRVYVFANNGNEKMYIGSADWMTRNLDHRIEVVTPILDKDIAAKIRETLMLQLEDTTKARIMDREQQNGYVVSPSKQLRSQIEIYKMLKLKTFI